MSEPNQKEGASTESPPLKQSVEEDIGSREKKPRQEGTVVLLPPLPIPAPLPPAARRGVGREPSLPGAYAVQSFRFGGGNPNIAAQPNPRGNDPSDSSGNNRQAGGGTAESGLVEARPISLPTLENADPVYDGEEANQRRGKRSRGKFGYYLSYSLLAFALVALTVTVGVVITYKRREADDTTARVDAGGPSNDTFQATAMPTPEIDLNVPLALPAYMMEAITGNYSSPQHHAYLWLQQDPQVKLYSEERLQQRFALATFYFATSGYNWTYHGGNHVSFPVEKFARPGSRESRYNASIVSPREPDLSQFINVTSSWPWLSYGGEECDWFSLSEGVMGESTCSDDALSYQYLDAEANNLAGSLPAEIGLLTSLKGVFLGQSRMQGPIVTQIGQLQELRDLDLGESFLTGRIPSEIGLLSDTLETLALNNNLLTGSIPNELWQLSNLQQAVLQLNQLEGTLVFDIGLAWSHLKILMISQNQMNGTLPTSLGLMTDLLHVDAAENNFSGILPTELGELSQVTRLFLANNRFTGTLPSELAKLTKLIKLNLQGNLNMTGPFPQELGLLNESLTTLQIQGTSISGTIPEELCFIKKLRFHCSESLCGCGECPCSQF